MPQFALTFLPGDIFGLLALGFIGLTSVLMLGRKTLLKYTKNLDLLRRIHIFAATLGGFFLILHVAYFISYPITSAVILGYIATGAAGVVWVTGMAFLERFRDTLFYHGALSLSAFSLMVIHAASSGVNFPIDAVYVVIALTLAVVLYKASQHAGKLWKSIESVGAKRTH